MKRRGSLIQSSEFMFCDYCTPERHSKTALFYAKIQQLISQVESDTRALSNPLFRWVMKKSEAEILEDIEAQLEDIIRHCQGTKIVIQKNRLGLRDFMNDYNNTRGDK